MDLRRSVLRALRAVRLSIQRAGLEGAKGRCPCIVGTSHRRGKILSDRFLKRHLRGVSTTGVFEHLKNSRRFSDKTLIQRTYSILLA